VALVLFEQGEAALVEHGEEALLSTEKRCLLSKARRRNFSGAWKSCAWRHLFLEARLLVPFSAPFPLLAPFFRLL